MLENFCVFIKFESHVENDCRNTALATDSMTSQQRLKTLPDRKSFWPAAHPDSLSP